MPNRFLTLTLAVAASTLLLYPGTAGYALHAHDDLGLTTDADSGDGTSSTTTPLTSTPTTTESDVSASPSSPTEESGVMMGPRGVRLEDDRPHEPTTGSSTPVAQTTVTTQQEQEYGHSTGHSAPSTTAEATAVTTEMGEQAKDEKEETDSEDKAHKLVVNYFREPSHHTYQVSNTI